jgi:hypothetical protein
MAVVWTLHKQAHKLTHATCPCSLRHPLRCAPQSSILGCSKWPTPPRNWSHVRRFVSLAQAWLVIRRLMCGLSLSACTTTDTVSAETTAVRSSVPQCNNGGQICNRSAAVRGCNSAAAGSTNLYKGKVMSVQVMQSYSGVEVQLRSVSAWVPDGAGPQASKTSVTSPGTQWLLSVTACSEPLTLRIRTRSKKPSF